jgi:hypothetical protein
MVPLSCLNCCHNPLQLGPIGTAFGYCTRHRIVLTHPQATTCGQLLRKDLLAREAGVEQAKHAAQYSASKVVVLTAPKAGAIEQGLAERPNGQLPADPVIDEVRNFGSLDSKIATMAALHRIPGCRAEVAMLSLSRSYFRNCTAHGGKWTAGVHLLEWTLGRLEREPVLAATDLQGPISFSLERTIAVARWTVVAFRLSFIADVAARARKERDSVGRLAQFVDDVIGVAPPDEPQKLLAALARRRSRWRRVFPEKRYTELREELHADE